MAISIFITNLPTFLVVIAAIFLIKNKSVSHSNLFISGLAIILIAGLLAVPSSALSWQLFPELVNTPMGTALFSAIFGVIQGIGIILCVIAYVKGSSHAN